MKKQEILSDPIAKVLELDFMKKRSVITDRIIRFVKSNDIPMDAEITIEETRDYHYLERKNRTYNVAENVGCRGFSNVFVFVMAEWGIR